MDKRWKEGLELFNQKDYFECHDAIEELWLETSSGDPHRDLYKGVIQAAAAIYQFDRGILSGAFGLYKTSVGYLEKYRPRALGLNTDKLILEMNECFASLENWDGKSKILRMENKTPVLEYRF